MEFRLLGPFEVVDDGRKVTPSAAKERTVLALLLLHANEVISSQRLIDELWGERPPSTAPKLVQAYISHLRKEFADVILTRPPGYVAIVDSDRIDAFRFAALAASGDPRAALALWRGPALEDVGFESTGAQDVARLEEQRLTTLAQRIDLDLASGLHEVLVPELEHLVAEYPLREHFRAQLMLALYRSGRQSEALETYAASRRALSNELGLDPGPELRELQARILNHDPALIAPVDSRAERPNRRRVSRVAWAATLVVALAAAALFVARNRDESTSPGLPPNTLARLDTERNEVVARVPLGTRPSAAASGVESIWVTSRAAQAVLRVDPGTGAVTATVPTGGHPTAVAVGRRDVWVRNGVEGTVVRIDPSYLAASPPVPVGGGEGSPLVAAGVPGIAVSGNAVWAVSPAERVVRLDAGATADRSRLRLPGGALGPLLVARGSLWVAGAQSLTEVDLASGQAVPPIRVRGNPVALASSRDALWIAYGSTVQELHMPSHTVRRTIELPSAVTALAATPGAIWVAGGPAQTVWRFDADSGAEVAAVELGAAPVALIEARGSVWVAVQ